MNWTDLLVVSATPENPSDADIRSAVKGWRNRELEASDWTQLPDIEIDKVDVAAWRIYRQKLRDMLDTDTPIKEIVFPVKPA